MILMKDLDELCVNTLRFLAVDAVEKAQSGHPGAPLGMAPMAYVLWDRFLRHNPRNPRWFNRDRFILSAGHASALLYSLLHLYGYDISLEDLKSFRQWGSKTPGHPEYDPHTGIELTTGPLGQGFGMGVGMAIAERFLASNFNNPQFPVVNHHVYAICSDGDLMEGVSSEAASLAGTLKLNKLIYLYDDNHITIEGSTALAFTENVQARFEAYGWNVLRVTDGNDLDSIKAAIRKAQTEKEKPSLIIVRTHIGYGSPKQDTAEAHGEPLGKEALEAAKEKLNWPRESSFYIPEEVSVHCRKAIEKGAELEAQWQSLFNDYLNSGDEKAKKLEQVVKGKLPSDWISVLPEFHAEAGSVATRNISGDVLNALAKKLSHFIIGGSADLAPSNKTFLKGLGDFCAQNYCSNNLHFGVREHAMGAIANGIALHSNLISYTGTFLVFSDYMRPALRLSALMKTNVKFVFTHDSIAMGEDGPTHQPIEQLMSLRIIPFMTVFRPADANETVEAWKEAIKRRGPIALLFTRQKLPILDLDKYPVKEGVSRGAYILSDDPSGKPDVILIGTGSEVHLALASQEELKRKGVKTRVVSMPSWELFEQQPDTYKEKVLPKDVPKLAIEAGTPLGWHKYVGAEGDVIGINRFGASAPEKTIYEKLGFSVDNVVKHTLALLSRVNKSKRT